MDRRSATNEDSSLVVLVVCLWACAGLLALCGAVYGIARLILAIGERQFDARVLLGSLVYVVGGLSAGCVLWALAYLVRHARTRQFVQRSAPTYQPKPDQAAPTHRAAASQPGAIDPGLGERILAELSEVNTSLLLTEDDRRAKREARQSQLAQETFAEAEQAIEARDFQRAERAAQRLQSEFADRKRHNLLMKRISEGQATLQAEHIASETRRVEELMSVASFRQAQDVARELVEKYPDSSDAQALVDRVLREAEAFLVGQRKRLYDGVQRAAKARRWREAFASAQRLLGDYPNSGEADKVARRMPTIQENARIEEARQLRDEIRDLIQRRRYAEAVRIAHEILARFPDTQAAVELRPQIQRLEELAEGEDGAEP
ncbi:MAG: hypothetical protein ACYTF6_02135 [Planctomycetota bacterium]|jgi:outer membrane protein assembly factor BamD (BamD/ComL family)